MDVHCQYINKDFYTFNLIYRVRYCHSLSEKLHDWIQCEGKARCVGGQGGKTCIFGRGANHNCSRTEVYAIFLFPRFFLFDLKCTTKIQLEY